MNRLIIVSILLLITGLTFSQTGEVNIHDHADVQRLVDQHIYFNKEHSKIPGWRIQVYSTPSMNDAKQEKVKLLRYYSNTKATIVFEAPNYKIRIGNYRDRFDAYRDIQELLHNYPDAFICKDLINVKGI